MLTLILDCHFWIVRNKLQIQLFYKQIDLKLYRLGGVGRNAERKVRASNVGVVRRTRFLIILY